MIKMLIPNLATLLSYLRLLFEIKLLIFEVAKKKVVYEISGERNYEMCLTNASSPFAIKNTVRSTVADEETLKHLRSLNLFSRAVIISLTVKNYTVAYV